MQLRTINKEIEKKYPGIYLVKGNGYFYLTSDDTAKNEVLAGLYCTSINVNSLKDCTVSGIMFQVDSLLKEVISWEPDKTPAQIALRDDDKVMMFLSHDDFKNKVKAIIKESVSIVVTDRDWPTNTEWLISLYLDEEEISTQAIIVYKAD